MSGSIFRSLVVAIALATAGPAVAANSLLTLTPRPGATLGVLVDKPASPRGSVILLAGDNGVLDLDDKGAPRSGLQNNQLIRTRAMYVAAGYAVFAPDIASDLKSTSNYRFGAAHATDLAAVIQEARKIAGPVVVVGTSRGAISAVDALVNQSTAMPDALVISSGVLMADRGGSARTIGNLDRVRVPVLLIRHRLDACKATPPGDADAFKALLTGAPRVDIVTMTGGGPQSSSADPCGAAHYHGFNGIDGEVVKTTVDWVAANARR